ncbi:MAG TPA: four helix bundle protein [Acidobacteriaceae bacterium]
MSFGEFVSRSYRLAAGGSVKLAVYKLTSEFPREELYGLTNQLRRASVSIPSNIAEGWGRQLGGDYMRFLAMARGSNMELQTQLIIATELGFGNEAKRKTAEELSHEVGKMLVALMKSIPRRDC